MDSKSIFSALSFVSVFIYMYVGIYTYRHNTKSLINRVFLSLCTSYAIWSFAYAFAYASNNKIAFSFWNKISALGWCSFSAITLYLVLLITDNKLVKNKLIVVFVFSPAVIFFYMSVFLFGVGINTPTIISNIFYIGDFLYNFTFLIISIILIFFWGAKTDSKRIKIQSKILV
ncbi:MAG TPA: diguanylate cyclase, partial [Clostridiaceae bacterium]|nr:diguanylate cyclase [Clostridiaceae bacterium]